MARSTRRQQGADPGDDLAHPEGLGEVVVGADTEAHEDVALLVAGGEHEDRHGTFRLDASADLEAVEARQHLIQQHDLGAVLGEGSDRRRPVVRPYYGEALRLEAVGQRLVDRRIVLDDEEPSRWWGHGAGHGLNLGSPTRGSPVDDLEILWRCGRIRRGVAGHLSWAVVGGGRREIR